MIKGILIPGQQESHKAQADKLAESMIRLCDETSLPDGAKLYALAFALGWALKKSAASNMRLELSIKTAWDTVTAFARMK